MGKHKKFEQEEEVVSNEVAEETATDSNHNHSNGKSKHKESKRKRHENSDLIAELPIQDEEVQSKKKKKKKKHHEEVQEIPQEEPVVEASNENNEEDKKSEKKKKKKHSEQNANGIGSSSFICKCYYGGHAKEDAFSDEEVQQFWEKHQMTVAGSDSKFKPVRTFKEVTFIEKKYKDVLEFFTKNFEKPTPIQSQCWPIGLSGRDLIGIAETGSGKTLAYLLPALISVTDRMTNEQPRKKGPYVLVLAPTRELAMQIYDVAASCQHLNISATYLVGGLPKPPQIASLKQGVHVVIATPGRLKDLMNEGYCSLANVNFLILDEADQMLDMGFEKDIREICGQVPKKRQTLMFSATWPKSIQALANEFLNQPVHVTIGSEDLAACSRVKQIVEVIDDQKRRDRLLQVLKEYHSSRKNRILIFVLYKWEAAEIDRLLKGKNWNAIYINSDRSQQQRTEALQAFKDGSVPILVATDVAARGLDIPNVEYVINYSFPLTIEQYVHRIGRTARAGKEGVAHTFFTRNDKAHAGELVNVLRDANQKIPDDLLKFGVAIKKKEHKLYGHHFKNIDENAASTQPKRVVFDDE